MTMSGAKAIATDDRKITEKKMEMAVRDLTWNAISIFVWRDRAKRPLVLARFRAKVRIRDLPNIKPV